MEVVRFVVKKFGMISTNIERDSNIPPLIDLEAELTKAKMCLAEFWGYECTKSNLLELQRQFYNTLRTND